MSYASSKNAQLFVGIYDLTSYTREASPEPAVETADSTVFGDAGRRSVPVMVAGGMGAEFLYDRTANSGFDVVKTALQAAAGSIVTLFPEGSTAGYPAVLCYANTTRMGLPVPIGQLLSTSGYFQAAEDGIDIRGESLHAKSAETGTANGTTVDSGASSSNGGVGVLHVTGIAGGAASVTIKIQHSTDGSTWADLITFTTATTVVAERVEVASGTTVNRYLRSVVTFGGITTSVTPVVAFARR